MEKVQENAAKLAVFVAAAPDDLKMSVAMGLCLCIGFLVFGNSKTAIVHMEGAYSGDIRTPSSDTQSLDEIKAQLKEQGEQLERLMAHIHAEAAEEADAAASAGDGGDDNSLTSDKGKKGKKNKKGKTGSKTSSTAVVAAAAAEPTKGLPKLSEEEADILQQLRKMQAEYKLSDETLREAIAKTLEQNNRGISSQAMQNLDESPFTFLKMLDWAVLLTLLLLGAMALNSQTNGNAGRWLCAFLPKEMELIGLSEYLLTYDNGREVKAEAAKAAAELGASALGMGAATEL